MELVVDVGFTRPSNRADEAVAIADVRIDVGEALSRKGGVDVGWKPGGGSISCLERREVDVLKEVEEI